MEKIVATNIIEHNPQYLFFLRHEIEYLESQIKPEDTGHIRTAVSVLKLRLRQLENELGLNDHTN